MGPQPFGCGRPLDTEGPSVSIYSLQWGRNLSVAEGSSTIEAARSYFCFNGAATFRLRKGHSGRWCGLARGALQWGRNLSVAEGTMTGCAGYAVDGFNGAATFRLRKAQDGVLDSQGAPASMGPQPFGCGRHFPPPSPRPAGHASMGPQPFGCGRGAVRRRPAQCSNASMGPQPFGCGRASRPRRANCSNSLQWGRNLSVAEGCEGRRDCALQLRLQWGRNLSVAEGGGRRRLGGRSSGFNGAATFRLRKVIVWCAGRGRVPASMGPQPFGCGRRLKVGAAKPLYSRFNGAATFRLRKGAPRASRAGPARRFNGAATFRLRKGPAMRGGMRRSPALQWGRNLSVAEGAPRSVLGPCRASLQWGRNLSVAEGSATPTSPARSPSASMGPQPFGCGRGGRVGAVNAVGAASMGPQPFGCGRRTGTLIKADLQVRLQWGRNLSVAEGNSSIAAPPPPTKLQWGRNLSVAEGRPTGRHLRNLAELQWGRNLSVAEGE